MKHTTFVCDACGKHTLDLFSDNEHLWVLINITQDQGGSELAQQIWHICDKCWSTINTWVGNNQVSVD